MESFDTIIIGGGPAGLRCAKILSSAGVKVLLLERKKNIGVKVCAGGITWDGLVQKVPDELIERSFNAQYIYSGLQNFCFKKNTPVIATVNRNRLGQWMLKDARNAGAEIRNGWYARTIEDRTLTASNSKGDIVQFRFHHLVGADGSNSLVRKSLGLSTKLKGIGINYQVPGHYDHMEWHLNPHYFNNGYGWIFPHRESVSIGAYGTGATLSAKYLNRQLIQWAKTRGFVLDNELARAELINYDYRGFHFGNLWLAGDAAGLASGLTGEGIHPAMLSGEAVAKKILDPCYPAKEINVLVNKKKHHELVVKTTGVSKIICSGVMELLILLLRCNFLDFQKQLSM